MLTFSLQLQRHEIPLQPITGTDVGGPGSLESFLHLLPTAGPVRHVARPGPALMLRRPNKQRPSAVSSHRCDCNASIHFSCPAKCQGILEANQEMWPMR